LARLQAQPGCKAVRKMRHSAKDIPSSPGVYLMKGSRGEIIYIGKAKNLRERVGSYFSGEQEGKTARMVGEIKDIDFIVTDNETEALILEASLIRQNKPKYNVDLRDSERFTYIIFSNERFARIFLARNPTASRCARAGSKVFGPFAKGSARILVVDTLRKIFGLRTCRNMPRRACLQYHMGNCTAPCEGRVGERKYAEKVKEVEKVLSGKGGGYEGLLEKLKGEMEYEAGKRNFERAAKLRDSLRVLEGLQERQKIERVDGKDEDYLYYARNAKGAVSLQMFRVIGGVIKEREKHSFEAEKGKELEEFMLAHYAEGNIPQKIYVQEEFGGRKALEGYLGGIAGSRVAITVPQKGDKKKLLELLAKNMESEIPVALVKLRRALSLREIPRVIECFDVSNLGKEGIVGAMVRFVDGKPDKGNYRKFKIKEVKGQDDFASMKEIVFRRYLRLGRENAEMPNLVLVDGGVGQLNSAMKALSELGVDLECISLAKEEEKVYSPKFSQPIALPKTDEGLKILMHARDEAHRFAISYQRKVRGRSSGIA